MTASCCQTTETLGESIAAALREKKPVMLASGSPAEKSNELLLREQS